MAELTLIHYIFIIVTVFILAALVMKKEIVIPCILGILAIGFAYSKNIITSIQVLNNSLIASCAELFGVMLVITLVTAMSKSMQKAGIDVLMMKPVRKVIKSQNSAFWILGICMLIVSWLLWPSPAIALIGALLLPVAKKAKLPAIWAAAAMNLFGHGMGLSSDFFIQGAPAITAKSAHIDVTQMMSSTLILWIVMSVTVAITAFIMMKRDLKYNKDEILEMENDSEETEIKDNKSAKILMWLVILSFAAIIFCMIKFKIVGSDATALIAGVSLILTCIITMCTEGVKESLTKSVDYLKDGFIFSIKIFTPVIVIAAFFFMGSGDFAVKVLGDGAPAILNDISMKISSCVPINNFFRVVVEMAIGAVTGLDGSGFSGLPIVGSIAATFTAGAGLNTGVLAALGQITTIWIGGGTIIPWAVIPVAAICDVSPAELARKNLVPVLAGLLLTGITAVFLL